ncbi:MAG: TfoX/Sxy family protein [Hyphomicrobiaceae bacterium]
MAVSPGFKAFVAEQLATLGPVTIRAMFGGAGVYAEGVMLALIVDDTLYLKTDATGATAYEAEGSMPFSYETRNGTHTLSSYWRVPERLFDDPDEMTDWARRALGIASAGARRSAKSGRDKTAGRGRSRTTRSAPKPLK